MPVNKFNGLRILFVLVLALASGCVVTPQEQPAKRVLADVLVFRDLKEVDLDKDGAKEIIAIYATHSSASGVKVIKFRNGKGEVIFERIFDTSDIKFEIKNGVPVLMVNEAGEAAGCDMRGVKSVYRWDGKAFVLSGKQ